MKLIILTLCLAVALVKAFPRLGKKEAAVIDSFHELFIEDKSLSQLQAKLEEFLDEYREYRLSNQQNEETTAQFTTEDPSMFTSTDSDPSWGKESHWDVSTESDQSTTDGGLDETTTTDEDLDMSVTHEVSTTDAPDETTFTDETDSLTEVTTDTEYETTGMGGTTDSYYMS